MPQFPQWTLHVSNSLQTLEGLTMDVDHGLSLVMNHSLALTSAGCRVDKYVHLYAMVIRILVAGACVWCACEIAIAFISQCICQRISCEKGPQRSHRHCQLWLTRLHVCVTEKSSFPIDTNSEDFPAALEILVGIFACSWAASSGWTGVLSQGHLCLGDTNLLSREEWREAEIQLLFTVQNTKETLSLFSEALAVSKSFRPSYWDDINEDGVAA